MEYIFKVFLGPTEPAFLFGRRGGCQRAVNQNLEEPLIGLLLHPAFKLSDFFYTHPVPIIKPGNSLAMADQENFPN